MTLTPELLIQVGSMIFIGGVAYGAMRLEGNNIKSDFKEFKDDMKKALSNGSGIYPRLNKLEGEVKEIQAICNERHHVKAVND